MTEPTSRQPHIDEAQAIGLIPARGGSKSVPLKNIHDLCGRPLIDYVIRAAQEVHPSLLSRIVCSTDSAKIADVCQERNVDVIERPAEFGTDMARVETAIRHVLETLEKRNGVMPGIVVLFQPTSPFVLPEHISGLVEMMRNDPTLDTSQTVAKMAHCYHALSQRMFDEQGKIVFCYPEERSKAYNKALKPTHLRFGNLLAVRSRSILAGNSCFDGICGGLEIDELHATDVDGPPDFDYATYLLETGKIKLPYSAV